jgi:3-oxoacyl-[acyl-carrier protein] reductase
MDRMLNLKEKKALVTGGGTGIGRGIALALAEAGADVIVHYGQNKNGADEVVEQIKDLGRNAIAIQADVLEEEQIKGLMDEAASFFDNKIDILVNNAGHLVQRATIEEMSTELWHKVMDVNVTSTFLVTKYALPLMKEDGGRIVNMSSLAAHNGGGPGASAYAASKGAVMTLSKALAKELAGYAINVNAVSPGFIDNTPFHQTFSTPEARENSVKSIPIGRGGESADVAGAVLYLVSDLGNFITGETIEINGGMFMR